MNKLEAAILKTGYNRATLMRIALQYAMDVCDLRANQATRDEDWTAAAHHYDLLAAFMALRDEPAAEREAE